MSIFTEYSKDIYARINLLIITLLMVFMPLARGGVHGWMKAVMAAGVLAGILVLLLEHLLTGKPNFYRTKLFWPIITLFLWLFISALGSQVRSVSFESLFLAVVYTGFYYLVVNSIRTRTQHLYIVYLVIGLAFILSVIGFLKYVGLTLPWWQYDDLGTAFGMTSTYGNHNHFAGYLEMSLPFVLSLFLTQRREIHIKLLLLLIVVVISSALLFSLSRGGWTAISASMVFMVAVLFSLKKFQQKKALIIITVSFSVLVLLTLAGTNVVERALTLTQGETITELNGRSLVWDGTKEMIKDYKIIGTGPGSFAIINTRYQSSGIAARFYHAHNDYLQFMAELGFPIILFIIWFLAVIFLHGQKKFKSKSRQTRGFTLGALTGIVALMVHSIVDFNLRIPANAMLFIALIALVMVRMQGSSTKQKADS